MRPRPTRRLMSRIDKLSTLDGIRFAERDHETEQLELERHFAWALTLQPDFGRKDRDP